MMHIRLANLSARAARQVRRRKTIRPYVESLEQRTLLVALQIVQSSFLLTATLSDTSQQETASLPVGLVSPDSYYEQQASITDPVTFLNAHTTLSAFYGYANPELVGRDEAGYIIGGGYSGGGSTLPPGVPQPPGVFPTPSGSISGSVTFEVIPDNGDDPSTLSDVTIGLDANGPLIPGEGTISTSLSYSGGSGQGTLSAVADGNGNFEQQAQLIGLPFDIPIQLVWTVSAQGGEGSGSGIELVASPVLADLVANDPDWTPGGGADLNYSINASNLPVATDADLYWAADRHLRPVRGHSGLPLGDTDRTGYIHRARHAPGLLERSVRR